METEDPQSRTIINRANEIYVDEPSGLADLVRAIEKAPSVAVDTEADSLHSYFEKLCLVQVGIPGLDAVVDPLAGFDLLPMLRAFEGRRVIFHGADFDLRMLQRIGEFRPTEVFDTMIAARLVGLPEFSLAALVKEFFGIVLSKASQKANWGRRPLSEAMLEYAYNDTRFLVEISERLEEKLTSMGRLEWCRQTCERAVSQALAPSKQENGKERWKIKGWATTRGRETVVLKALWEWRESEAKAIDRPSFHILRNEELLTAAKVYSEGGSYSVNHLSGGKRRRLHLAAQEALALPEEEWPKQETVRGRRMTPGEEKQVDRLKEFRDKQAAELQIDPSLIAPRSTLERIVIERHSDMLLPWQRSLLFPGE